MEALKKRRSIIKGQMTKILTFAETIEASTTHDEIKVRLDRINNLLNEFSKIEGQMFDVTPDFESQNDIVDEIFYSAVALLTGAIRPFLSAQHNSTMINGEDAFQLSAMETKLPRLQIPVFQGDYQDWQSFLDLFNSSVHGKKLISAAQKLQYLKSLLKGEPLSLIKHLSVTDANYIEAYQILIKRYDKKKITINSYIDTFFQLPAITRISSSNIRNLATTTEEIIRGLKAVGAQGESRDPWLIHIIVNKLDDDSRQYWQHEASKIEHPTFQNLIDCLLTRAESLEGIREVACKPMSQLITRTRQSHTTTTMYTTSCPLCKTEHMLYQCPQFKAMSITERRAYIQESSRCYNCLSDNHIVQSCRSKRSCQICGKRHNSLLHLATTIEPHTSVQLASIASVMSPTAPLIPSLLPVNCSSINMLPINHDSSINTQVNSPINMLSTKSDSSNHTPNQTIADQSCSTNTLNVQSTQLSSTTQVQAEASCPSTNITGNEAILPFNPSTHVQSLLPTAVVHVKDVAGHIHTCRVLLDSGSQASFVTERFSKRLSLPIRKVNVKITGVGSSLAGIANRVIDIDIHSRYQPHCQLNVQALVLPRIAMPLPSTSFQSRDLDLLKELQLADPSYSETNNIDLLIGAEHFFDIITNGKISGSTGATIAQNSIFGWVIVGNMIEDQQYQRSTVSMLSEIDINSSLQRFWETEEIPPTKHLTEEEQLCDTHFEQTHTRSQDGRFLVRLPFKPNKCQLGKSVNTAIQRFLSLETRFQRYPQLKEQYISFMREYISLGHMKLIPPEEIKVADAESYYLPHHAVLKESSTTTKLRVVFDASSKTTNHISLNDTLLVGPTVQNSLYSILVRFRKHCIVFAADIEKMYRQIGINQQDTDYQRICWREDPLSLIQHYRLLTVTYGTASAPFLATKTLIKLADEYQNQYPAASKAIRDDIYVDDLMSGANTEQEAHILKEQIIEILTAAKLPLRKWTSNCPRLLNTIPVETQELAPVEIHEGKQSIKLLGLEWSPQTDTFHFKVLTDPKPSTTKREMLSEASKIFDPIGWLSPSIIMVKSLFQSLWLLNLQWDDPLPTSIYKKWMSLRMEFKQLERISVPRWLQIKMTDFQLHGFSDASETAYSAVIYTRCKNGNGTFITNIVTAKTRVAPIKPVSIPRLELCAALLLTKLMITVLGSLQCPNAATYLWTDSANVLWWLSSHPRSWKTYIANRTSEILETTDRSNWHYVPTRENPADCASRGILPSVLVDFELWWKGPSWLVQGEEYWPDQKKLQYTPDNYDRKKCNVNDYIANIKNEFVAELADKYSQFSKLIRIVARLLQFINNIRSCKNHEPKFGLVSPTRFKTASNIILKWVQRESFSVEVHLLAAKKSLPKSSKMVSLNPFFDADGIIRVGSRIRHANIQYDTKFPVILPADHIITQLIIDEIHTRYLHASQSLLISTIRQKYWIINCKNAVRQRIRKCVSCTRHRAAKINQLMGDLPPERVNFKYSFFQTGVDYAGPIWLKAMIGRKITPHKGYIAIFVCLSSKAVHIELVSDLTTEAFIATLKRFMSRRGVCADIFSDNGTNFVGASNTFAEIQKLVKSNPHNNKISNFLLDFNTKWHFIPPSAPSFGGLWEAAVKSTKYHIRRVLGNTILNFEEMATLLTQIEAILNSRPLCLLSPDEEDALTPAHFLTGQPLTMLPDPDYKPVQHNRLSRWQLVQQLMQHFWTRWHNEYLTSLHNRSKWQHKYKNLAVNDVVLLREDNIGPARWPLGRITELHPGKDAVVRVVTVKTKTGLLKRPILKLVLLPLY